MSRTLNLYRSTNNLTHSELPPPDDGKVADSDVLEENALEFYRFELAILQVSGAQDQLETYAATQEHLAIDEQQAEKQDDPVWTQIQNDVKNEINHVGSKIQDVDITDVSEQEAIDDPVTKVTQYTDYVAKTGLTDQNFRTSLLPSSIGELITEVRRRADLNTLIGGWIRRKFSPASAEPTADKEHLRQAVRADALYNHLAVHSCPGKGRRAFLQLSGWADSLEWKNVFQMFLSCCSEGTLHKAKCIFESSEPENNREPQINICSKIMRTQLLQAPLLLSFNDNKLWATKRASRILLEHEIRPNPVDLEKLLTEGHLKTSDHEDSVRKFRFALLLASSLCSLYFGPWIQQDWSSCNVYIIPNGNGRLVEMLNEAYISCLLNTSWRQIYTPPESSRETSSTEICPRFFLSLAQLLLDIANGERVDRPSGQDDLNSWYALLADEVRKNIEDQLMKDYWSAIQGCLLYQENYDNQGLGSLDKENHERLRALEVIYEQIVRHLQMHLNFWKAKSVGSGLLAAAPSPPQPGVGPKVETKFILWADQDDDYKKVEKPIAEPSEFSFISQMKTFRDTYIETLSETTDNGDDPKRVRVAIIDTGLYIEEAELDKDGDPFLDHPDVQSRVVDRRNFFSPDETEPAPDDWEDEHGHGTHVARLLLQFAPRADVVVAKISNSKTLKTTKTTQLVNALRWAGEQADIINLSFSLGSMPEPGVEKVIKDLVSNNKLIFAAASNTGGYGSRRWPASSFGVFAVHATNEFGKPDIDMNPQPLPGMDNFATFGCDVPSYWKGHHRSISGTSFATPVAAAICANILEFARHKQPKNVVDGLTRYSAMRALFRNHMTLNNKDGNYHCFHPWANGLWDGNPSSSKLDNVLWEVSR